MEELIELTYRRPQPPVSRLEQLEKLKLEILASQPRGMFMTRYGKKLLEQGAKYYGKVIINGNS